MNEDEELKPKKKKDLLSKILLAVGGIALTLGLASIIVKGCKANNAMIVAKAESGADNLTHIRLLDQEPFISTIQNYTTSEVMTLRTYLSLNVTRDDPSEPWIINDVTIATYCYGDGLVQSVNYFSFYDTYRYNELINSNNYLCFQSGVDDDGDAFAYVSAYENDPIRRHFADNPLWISRQYDDDYVGSLLYDTYGFSPYVYLVDDLDQEKFYYFTYVLESQRLYSMINSYNNGYYQGLLDGYSEVQANPHKFDLWDDHDLNQKYQDGYQAGYAEVNGFSVPALIMTIFNAPVAILGGALDFEIFGINLKSFVFFLITLGVIAFIIKTFKGGSSNA